MQMYVSRYVQDYKPTLTVDLSSLKIQVETLVLLLLRSGLEHQFECIHYKRRLITINITLLHKKLKKSLIEPVQLAQIVQLISVPFPFKKIPF